MLTGTCIGFIQDSGCGLIYADEPYEGSSIIFVHFRDIQPNHNGWQGLEYGDRVSFVADQTLGKQFYRTCAATGEDAGFVQHTHDKQTPLVFCDAQHLTPQSIETHQRYVITGDIPEHWEIPSWLSQQNDILFYQCRWLGAANFSNLEVHGDLVFLGCSFQHAFTLKGANITGAVHMEACDFSGAGGASFRGLQAEALFLDFGVKGPRDMVWLNETCIQRNIVIGGVFESTIQVMRIQDTRVTSQTCNDNHQQNRACFQHLYLGKECYKSQNINKTILRGSLAIQGLTHGEVIHVDHAEVKDIAFLDVAGGVSLTCEGSKVMGNVSVEGRCGDQAKMQCINFQNTYIEGHFTIRHIHIQHLLNLDDATVERVIRLHQVSFSEHGGLQIARLSANRLVMHDFATLYGQTPPVWWKNARFMMLHREKGALVLDKGPDTELVQEYVLLKHLLSQEGQLRLEDEAFYNMRKLNHWYQDVGMLFYNFVFGWGVRLQNILASVAVILLLFAATYHYSFAGFDAVSALQLSIQATFLAFFGNITPEVLAGSPLSWVVLLQSVLGVVFITVFVGAYVRKLLR